MLLLLLTVVLRSAHRVTALHRVVKEGDPLPSESLDAQITEWAKGEAVEKTFFLAPLSELIR